VKRRFGPSRLLVVLLAIVALFAAACSSSSKSTSTSGNTTGATTQVPQGGTLTVGAEQEPDCMDWTDQCAGSSWGFWDANVPTMPRAFDAVKQSDGSYKYVPNVLLTGEPDLQTSPKMVVTYHINPKAVWNDGQPITSADFQYTWDHIVHGQNIYDPTGYNDIASVTDTDPATAVVTFSTNYAGWKGLFGGGYGILPSHLLKGQNQHAIMKDGYTFSGGPYEMPAGAWKKGQSITLVPNPKWYGPDKSHVDKIIFSLTADTSSEFANFKAGTVKMIYPQPQLDVVKQIGNGIPGANSYYTADTGAFEVIWINDSAGALSDVKVRQAIGYSIDRNAIVKALFGKLGVDTALNVINAPIVNSYSDPEAFKDYVLDTSKAASLLQSAGYTKDSSGIYAKGGQELSFTIQSTAGNNRRLLTEQVLQSQLSKVGIKLTIQNHAASDLFGTILPAGNFQLALYAQDLTTIDPGRCNIFCSKNIPGPSNQNSGQNWTRTNIPSLDPLLSTVDTNLDDSTRASSNKQADGITADQAISFPLDPLPNIVLWSKTVVGPVGDNAILGPWWNVQDWGVTS
jgi:peptide/nickel transport system substrate-binding protein